MFIGTSLEWENDWLAPEHRRGLVSLPLNASRDPAARLASAAEDFRAPQVAGRHASYTTLDWAEDDSAVAALVLEEREDGETVLLAAAEAAHPGVIVKLGKFHRGRGERSSSFKFGNGFVFDQVPVGDTNAVAVIPLVDGVATARSPSSPGLVAITNEPTLAFELSGSDGRPTRRIWVREERWPGERNWETLLRSHIPFQLPALDQFHGVRRVWTGVFGLLKLTRVQEALIEFEGRVALWCVDPASPKHARAGLNGISSDTLSLKASRLSADPSSVKVLSRDPSGTSAIIALGEPVVPRPGLGKPAIRPVS